MCRQANVDSPHTEGDDHSGAKHVGSFHSAKTTVAVADVGPLVWTQPSGKMPKDFAIPPPRPPACAGPNGNGDPDPIAKYGSTCADISGSGYSCDRLNVAPYHVCGTFCNKCAPWQTLKPTADPACLQRAADRWKGTMEGAQLGLARSACQAIASQNELAEIATGPLSVQFKLEGGAMPAGSGVTYSIEYSSGASAKDAEGGARSLHGVQGGTYMEEQIQWTLLPGAVGLETNTAGIFANTVNVPGHLNDKFVVFRVVSTSAGAAADVHTAYCRAYALSPTFRVSGGAAPPVIQVTGTSPAQGVVPVEGFVAAWTFSGPIYFPSDRSTRGRAGNRVSSVPIEVDGRAYTPAINGNQLTLSVTEQLSYSASIHISPPLLMSEPGVPSSAASAVSAFQRVGSAASVVSGVPTLSFTTGAEPPLPPPPPTPPQLTVLSPAFGAGSLSIESLVLQASASADVALGANGEVSVVGPAGVPPCTFPGTASSVVIENSKTLILQNIGSMCELRPGTEYTVSLSAGFVVATAGAAPSATAAIWRFTTLQEATPVAIDASMTLENVQDANGFVNEDAPIILHFSDLVFVSHDCAVTATATEAQPTCFVSITAVSEEGEDLDLVNTTHVKEEAWIPIVPHESYDTVVASGAGCDDTASWSNGHGYDCTDYVTQGWCDAGARAAAAGEEWTLGDGFNNPESNCCACGKEMTSQFPIVLSLPATGSSTLVCTIAVCELF